MKSLQQFIKESMKSQESVLGRFQEDDHRGYFGPICEMSRLGFIPKKNRSEYYEVVVWTDDPGYIPHVHVRDVATKGKEFDCCVKLESPEYFPHGKHTGRFNSQMKKEFIRFVSSVDKWSNCTYYESAIIEWNRNNSKQKVTLKRDSKGNAVIPDYSKLD